MFGIGWTEILVILVVALLLLGPNRLPEIARGLGRGLREIRRALHSLDEDESPPARWTGPAQPPVPPPSGSPATGPGEPAEPPPSTEEVRTAPRPPKPE